MMRGSVVISQPAGTPKTLNQCIVLLEPSERNMLPSYEDYEYGSNIVSLILAKSEYVVGIKKPISLVSVKCSLTVLWKLGGACKHITKEECLFRAVMETREGLLS